MKTVDWCAWLYLALTFFGLSTGASSTPTVSLTQSQVHTRVKVLEIQVDPLDRARACDAATLELRIGHSKPVTYALTPSSWYVGSRQETARRQTVPIDSTFYEIPDGGKLDISILVTQSLAGGSQKDDSLSWSISWDTSSEVGKDLATRTTFGGDFSQLNITPVVTVARNSGGDAERSRSEQDEMPTSSGEGSSRFETLPEIIGVVGVLLGAGWALVQIWRSLKQDRLFNEPEKLAFARASKSMAQEQRAFLKDHNFAERWSRAKIDPISKYSADGDSPELAFNRACHQELEKRRKEYLKLIQHFIGLTVRDCFSVDNAPDWLQLSESWTPEQRKSAADRLDEAAKKIVDSYDLFFAAAKEFHP